MMGPFLPALDLLSFSSAQSEIGPKVLSCLPCVYARVRPESLSHAKEYLKNALERNDTVFDVTSLSSTDDIVTLLDNGALQVVVSRDQCQKLEAVTNLEPIRLVLKFEGSDVEKGLWTAETRPVFISSNSRADALLELLTQRAKNSTTNAPYPTYISLPNLNIEQATRFVKADAVPVVHWQRLSLADQPTPDQLNLTDLLMANAESDRPDGLFATLVTDALGQSLGLVYSSKESVAESLRLGRGVYQSRKRGLWYKGDSSGDVQELLSIDFDCDSDCLRFTVNQVGRGFCHLATATCFGDYRGLARLQKTLKSRKESAPEGSYTARLFNDTELLNAKIREEANELCEATEKDHIAFEAADLMYFAMTKCIASGVSLEDVEKKLDAKSLKVSRRKGDAKPGFEKSSATTNGSTTNGSTTNGTNGTKTETLKEAASVPKSKDDPAGLDNNRIKMTRYTTSDVPASTVAEALQRPSQRSIDMIMGIVKPIIEEVRTRGDAAVLEYTHKFEKATSLKSAVIHAPFDPKLMQLPQETIDAIDISYDNIRKFHAAQKEEKPLSVETMPGVVCSRFARPIERVGLYVPGGTAVLPSTALMLGVPAMVAGCKKIVLASPPRSDGSITPEIVYVAHKVGAESIVLAGGAQAVAAMAYGTQSISKVDKILGPGNQFVTAAKMIVSNDTSAGVSIDMPAGPSEVLVVADSTSNPAFVASDLLSQAEHGTDSQVVLIAIDMSEEKIQAVEDELHAQASALPRVDIVRGAIDHSVTLVVKSLEEAMKLSNEYAPEHLILQNEDPERAAAMVENAGSVFIGQWTPESVGDYSAGVNHSLPTYGYARQYSGVNLASYVKHITSSRLTQQGLRNVGGAVMRLAAVEELEAHRRAVSMRLAYMDKMASE